MPFATVEAGAVIGDRTLIYPGVYIGHQSRVGADCVLYPNVVIRERITLGDRVIVHGGSVIGADGFGYEPDGDKLRKQEQFGTVVVEDDVEIGANVTVDRARFDVTRIGRGTKIDNLVQIAHNVILGEGCIIVSQVGIAGSARIGKNVVLAGQVGIVGHLTIGDNVKVAAQSGIGKDIPAEEVYFGSPAIPIRDKKRELAAVKKLPGLLKAVRDLEKRLSRLEAQSENDQESH
jgi:UDP-3-O-[3-hydroxymyristoyl] glucosamine N-acyltransferase